MKRKTTTKRKKIIRSVIGVLVLAIVALAVFKIGVHSSSPDTTSTPGSESADPSGDVRGQPRPMDTTDLKTLKPVELTKYYCNASLGRVRRNPDEIEAAIDDLTESEVDELCQAFLKTRSGLGIQGLAMALSRIGTEKALRTLGTYYKRDLPDSFLDNGVTRYLSATRSPIAEEILIDAYRNISRNQLRKAILGGLGKFAGSEAVTSLLIDTIPKIEEESEARMAIGHIADLGTARSVEFLVGVALGDYPGLRKFGNYAIHALGFSKAASAADALMSIARRRRNDAAAMKTCIESLDRLAKSGRKDAVSALYGLALAFEDGSDGTCSACIEALSGFDSEDSRKVLESLARDLKDEEMRKKAEAAAGGRASPG